MGKVNYQTKRLGINVDHVATLRQARGTDYPDPLLAAKMAIDAGADGITIHLREDRRHIQDHDVVRIRQELDTHLNLEMALCDEMLNIAFENKPDYICLVPEKREELTTEGGLNLLNIESALKDACDECAKKGIAVSLFIEALPEQIDMAKKVGATAVELHTGRYADTYGQEQENELQRIVECSTYGSEIGLIVNAGHGLNLQNVGPIVAIPEVFELNIGHSIVAQSVFDGFTKAVADMRALMSN